MTNRDIVEMAEVYQLFHRFRIMSNYKGYSQASLAVYFVIQNPKLLQMPTKYLYPAVAEKCRTNWRAVERNIRTVISMIWEDNAILLGKIAEYPLEKKPSATKFIAILAAALSDNFRAEMNEFISLS